MKKFIPFIFAFVFCFAAFADAPEQSIELSDIQVLQLAGAMAAHGEIDAAIQIYNLLLQSPDISVRTEAAFQLANIAMAHGNFNQAIIILRAILNRNPDLHRVRLELALAYFMNRNFQAAQFHFEFVRATPDLPAEVAARIDNFLMLIRRERNWDFDIRFAIVPDSNINTVSGITEECIMTIFGPLCRPLEEQASGVGVRLAAQGSHYTRLSERFGIRTTAAVSALDFMGHDWSDYSLMIASGPRYAFNRGEISLQPNYTSRWLHGNHFSHSYGLMLNTDWQIFGRTFIGGGANVRQNRFNAEHMRDLFGNSIDWGASTNMRHFIDNRSFILLGTGFNHSGARVDFLRQNSFNYSIGYFREFGNGWTSFSRIDLVNTRFRGDQWFVMQDQTMQDLRRRDWTTQFHTRLSHRRFQWNNLTPALAYTYTRRDSNVWSSEFDKHRIEIEIIRQF